MRIPLLIFALFVLCGCTVKLPRSDPTGGDLSALQVYAENIHDDALRGESQSVGESKFIFTEISVQALKLWMRAQVAAANHAKEVAAIAQERSDHAKEHAHTKWLGWQTWNYIYWIIGLWAASGVAAIVSGVLGLAGISAGLMRFIPMSNVFAFARDWIIAKRSTPIAPGTTVIVQSGTTTKNKSKS